jgi:hypothetical protein
MYLLKLYDVLHILIFYLFLIHYLERSKNKSCYSVALYISEGEPAGKGYCIVTGAVKVQTDDCFEVLK